MKWKFWKRDKPLNEKIMHALINMEPRVCDNYTRLKKPKEESK